MSYLSRTIDVRAVHQALAGLGEAMRSAVMSHFRQAGGSLNRWSRLDLQLMVDAMGRVEDALELKTRGRWTPARAGLRSIRRQLEVLSRAGRST